MARILVAEDEEPIRQLVTIILSAAGHTVMTATNGVEAVAVYRSFSSQIDAVIADINMPVMDGYQAMKMIRDTRPDARILCMSGHLTQPLPEGVMFVEKPFTAPQLTELVEELLIRK